MDELRPGVIPVSSDEFDRLYPVYELEAQVGDTFQIWLRRKRTSVSRLPIPIDTAVAKKVCANYIPGEP